jgi:hypothetical protein
MSVIRAYKLSLLLPLIVPALLAPVLPILSGLGIPFPEWLAGAVYFTVYSGIIGGIPYLVLVALLLLWARGKSEAQFRRGLVLSPLLMLPIVCVLIETVSLLRFGLDSTLSELGEVIVFYTPFVLGFGYAYVCIVLSSVWALRRAGWLDSAAPAI